MRTARSGGEGWRRQDERLQPRGAENGSESRAEKPNKIQGDLASRAALVINMC
jgi:hypothetical protein